MNEERRLQIYDYLKTLFRTIRNFIAEEPQYLEFVPDLFKATYSFQIYECTNGYIVAVYLGNLADNYHYNDVPRSVEAHVNSLPNLIAGTDQHVVTNLQDWKGCGLLQVVVDCVEIGGERVPTTGWKFLFISTKDWKWPTEDAKKQGEQYAREFRARAAVYEPSAGGFMRSYNVSVDRPYLVRRLQSLLSQYKAIISEGTFNERVIHRFLRDHPTMFFPTKKRVLYEYALKNGGDIFYRIDFGVELTTGRYILVELENPKHSIFTAKGDFSQIVNHAERQVRDWMTWIRKNPGELASDMPGLIAPDGLIVVGRTSDMAKDHRDKVSMRNETNTIRLVTYDDLAEEMENYIKHLQDI
jgi:Domain of unknown function (DUF4263)